MKINYLADSIIPSRSANSIHVMKMCNALARLGHDVTLVVPNYSAGSYEQGVEDVFEYYGLEKNIRIHYVDIPNIKGGVYLRGLKSALFAYRQKCDIIYSRDFWGSCFASLLRLNVYHEFHQPLLRFRGGRRYFVSAFYKSRYLKKLIVISEALKRLVISEGIEDDRIIVAHDAADEDFSEPVALSPGFHVGYVGHLYEGRGIELIYKMAKHLPEISFHLIGGRSADIQKRKEQNPPDNIIFHGFLPPAKVGAYRCAMDILLAPYQTDVRVWGGNKSTAEFMSPLKIFEYMSSKKPMIVSDLPVLREVLNSENAVLCAPEDASAWVQAILNIRENKINGKKLGEQAHNDFISKYTWKRRAEYIFNKL